MRRAEHGFAIDRNNVELESGVVAFEELAEAGEAGGIVQSR